MRYKKMTTRDAAFLTEIFSVPEYDMYFAENETTEDEWRDRITRYYQPFQSFIVFDEDKKVGWVMYEIEQRVCTISIIVLHPNERFKGYGKKIITDIIEQNPQLKEVRLDVQQRNLIAATFYGKLGFKVDGEEIQPVGDTEAPYYKMSLQL